ncbi:hypothetical protein FV219_06070 [Methylobacterium sp. WL122]|nr:hypothetical protein FV219_06070 [Methylobacterium sp. WL122]
MLTSAAPKPFLTTARARLGGPFDMLVLDEAPWLSFIGGCGPRPVQVLVEDLVRLASWPAGGEWRAEYLVIGRRLADALDGQDGYLKRDRLVEAGLSATMADQAAGLSWRLVRKLPIRRDLPPEAASFALHEHGEGNGAAALVRRFWTILAAFLRSGATVAPQTLQVGLAADGRSIVRLRWKEEMHRDWTQGPILYLDATLVPEVAACWLSGLCVEAVVQAAETDVYRVALLDRQNGKTSLVAAKTEAEEKRQARTVAKIVHLIETLAFRYRGRGRALTDGCPGPDVAVVGYDAFERRVRPLLPANVAVGHFNNLRGFDGWRGVRAIVVVGRPEPSPRDVEQYASIASGELVAPCPGKWYPAVLASHLMRDGTGRSIRGSAHPHPLVEAFRRQVQTELPQVEGRARPVRRGPRDPLASYVLTSTPTDLPLDEVTTEGDLLGSTGMLALLAARGIVPDTAADAAQVLSDLFDGSAGAADAFRQRLLREGRTDGLAALFETGEGARNDAGGEVVTFPYQSLLGICHDFAAMPGSRSRHDALPDAILGFRCFRYRPHDRRTGGSVLIDRGLHSDPEAALQAVVGPLASFVPAPAPSWLAAIQAPYVRAGRTPIAAAADVAISLPRAPSSFQILLATRTHAANSMLPLAGEIYTVGAKRLSVHIFPQPDGSDLKLYRRPGAAWPPMRHAQKRIVVERMDRSAAADPKVTAVEIAAALGLRHRPLMIGPSFARLERQFGREKALVYRMVEKVGVEAVQAASAKCLALAADR